jgi:alpha-galactosidase
MATLNSKKTSFLVATLSVAINYVSALENGLGRVPQMGWNTWNKFACGIDEKLIMQSADQIVEYGLDKLGYTYINIDDCW